MSTRTCSICSQVGHNIRTCSSTIIQQVKDEFQTVSTTVELENFFKKHTSEKLSIIMLAYGATNVSVNKINKEKYIRERWMQEHQQPLAEASYEEEEETHVESFNFDRFIQLSALPSHEQMKTLANQLYIFIRNIFNIDHIRTIEIFHDPSLTVMINMLSELVFEHTQHTHNIMVAIFVAKHVIKKFKIPRNDPLYRKNEMLARVIIKFQNEQQAENLLQQQQELYAEEQQQQQYFIPYKPPFKEIILVCYVAEKKDDYTCGICAGEYTRETIPTLNCAHTLCVDCIKGQIDARSKSCITCPYCREEIFQISIKNNEIKNNLKTIIFEEIQKNVLIL
jgi:hypothetical protein